jgi:hypothetical protein
MDHAMPTITHLTSVNAPSLRAARRASSRLLVGCVAAVYLVVAAGACEREREKPRLAAPIAPRDNSPESKLARVIERLKFGLSAAQGAANYGVSSKRECSYRLVPPSGKESNYTADVTIVTTLALTDAESKEAAADPTGASGEPAAPKPTHERQKFKLVYKNDRWELRGKPNSETLQLCFESALKDG